MEFELVEKLKKRNKAEVKKWTKSLAEKLVAADAIFWHFLVHHTQRMNCRLVIH